jgi:hypothetical protein
LYVLIDEAKGYTSPGSFWRTSERVWTTLHAIDRAGTAAAVAVIGGLLLALLPGRRPLHDRLAGTGLFFVGALSAPDQSTPGGFEVTPAAHATSRDPDRFPPTA